MTAMLRSRLLRRSDEGQALLEFALIAPVLVLILFAIIQFGFLLGGYVGMTNGTREAARYASTVPNATAAQVKVELTTRAPPKAILGFRAANVNNALTVVSFCSYPNLNHDPVAFPSYSIKVRITSVYRNPLFVPLIDVIVDGLDGKIDGALAATVSEEMRVENPRLTTDGGLAPCP